VSVAVATTPAPAVAVTARALAHRYAPGRGLDAVDFAIASPGVVAVTGANGAGKSTLLRILAGLLRPSAGEVTVTLESRVRAAAERRGRVGYASPDLHFYEEFTALENLVFAAEAHGLPAARIVAAAALERVALAARAEDRVAALSSGLRQRLRLAFALLHRPSLLLLDEPGSHLDDAGRALVEHIVREESRAGLVVIATNDEREWRLADQRIELRGRGLGRPA
jgi:heme exporter protein A